MNFSEEQLEALYKQAFPQVAKLIGQLGGSADIAKDLFHDALIILIEKQRQNRLSISGSITSYLVGITKMLLYQHQRRQRLDFCIDENADLDLFATESLQLEMERTEHLHKHLKQTGTKCLDLLTSYYYDKKPLDEIAEQLNYKNVRSATVQKFKCIEKLRVQMKQEVRHEAAA